jgi:hypothetical protein
MDRRAMGVTADHDLDARSFRYDVELLEIVNYIHPHQVDFEGLSLWQTLSPDPPVDVAAHCSERGRLAQSAQHGRLPDITCVNDQIGTLEGLDRLGSQETMGVGYQADMSSDHE